MQAGQGVQAFLSTPSARRATVKSRFAGNTVIFLSTPSARRATLPREKPRTGLEISIHALREEGDLAADTTAKSWRKCYCLVSGARATGSGTAFRERRHSRPTLLRDAPLFRSDSVRECRHFYPRPPRGGRQGGGRLSDLPAGISIHALREEGDAPQDNPPRQQPVFLSTPSARRATIKVNASNVKWKFLSTPSARRATWRRSAN